MLVCQPSKAQSRFGYSRRGADHRQSRTRRSGRPRIARRPAPLPHRRVRRSGGADHDQGATCAPSSVLVHGTSFRKNAPHAAPVKFFGDLANSLLVLIARISLTQITTTSKKTRRHRKSPTHARNIGAHNACGPATLRHRPRLVGSIWMAQEA